MPAFSSFLSVFAIQLLAVFAPVADFLEQHFFACPFRQSLHLDCPGCGLQRSVAALFRGNLAESFALHPASMPLLATFALLPLHLAFKIPGGSKVLIALQVLTGLLMIGFFGYKIYTNTACNL